MELITVFRTLNPTEAELVSAQLESAGFDVHIANEFSALTLPPAAASGIQVQVPGDQAEDARALIATTVGASQVPPDSAAASDS